MKENILIITGGSSGLGLEITKQAIERGLFVCNISRNKQKMNELDEIFKKNYRGFIGDITDEEFINKSIFSGLG